MINYTIVRWLTPAVTYMYERIGSSILRLLEAVHSSHPRKHDRFIFLWCIRWPRWYDWDLTGSTTSQEFNRFLKLKDSAWKKNLLLSILSQIILFICIPWTFELATEIEPSWNDFMMRSDVRILRTPLLDTIQMCNYTLSQPSQRGLWFSGPGERCNIPRFGIVYVLWTLIKRSNELPRLLRSTCVFLYSVFYGVLTIGNRSLNTVFSILSLNHNQCCVAHHLEREKNLKKIWKVGQICNRRLHTGKRIIDKTLGGWKKQSFNVESNFQIMMRIKIFRLSKSEIETPFSKKFQRSSSTRSDSIHVWKWSNFFWVHSIRMCNPHWMARHVF